MGANIFNFFHFLLKNKVSHTEKEASPKSYRKNGKLPLYKPNRNNKIINRSEERNKTVQNNQIYGSNLPEGTTITKIKAIENKNTISDSNKCQIISAEMLKEVFIKTEDIHTLEQAAKEMNYIISDGQINSELRIAHFLGQCRQKTGGYILSSENLNYKVSVLKEKFSYYRNNPELAEVHGRKNNQDADQQAIANHAYANRIGNGDINSGDGWKFRGRGIKQLTGRNNYKKFTEFHKKFWEERIDFTENPNIISNSPKYAIRSAIYFWIVNDLAKKADKGATKAVSDSISTVINKWDGNEGFLKRYLYMKQIIDEGTFKYVCFNNNASDSNKEAKTPS